VRSGHGVFSNPEAVQEVIRILRLASRRLTTYRVGIMKAQPSG
jgi:hypothetical protein